MNNLQRWLIVNNKNMEAKFLNKYINKPLPWLITKCQESVNEYIRLRDKDETCISCGKYKELQAGHFYSAGHNQCLRFNEDNIHGQCVQCNMHLNGNLLEYRKGLIRRYNEDFVTKLDETIIYYQSKGYKHDRIGIIETMYKYRKKVKELK